MRRLPLLPILLIIIAAACGKKDNSEASSSAADSLQEATEVADYKPLPVAKPGLGSGPYSNARIHVNDVGPLREVFNDSNYRQYELAEKFGITPITDLGSAYFTKHPLVHITSNQYYYVDSLTHSVPFLVPRAANLLTHIGQAFIDSLHSRGADGYLIKVTSLLRTPQSVKKLRRVNRNATDSSTHQYATTFDLSWAKFYCKDSTRTIHDGDLKNLLAEVLLDARKEGRCLVKYEHKTCCFHITVAK